MFFRLLSQVPQRLTARRLAPRTPTARFSVSLPWGHPDYIGRSSDEPKWRATTILSIRKDGEVIVIGDGQVSFGDMVLKPNAKKVRVIDSGRVITGFAGATADCLTLLERLETRLEQRPGWKRGKRRVLSILRLLLNDVFICFNFRVPGIHVERLTAPHTLMLSAEKYYLITIANST